MRVSGWPWALRAPRCGGFDSLAAAIEQDLPHLRRFLEQPVRFHRLREWEDPVDHRLDPMLRDELDHRAEVVVGTHVVPRRSICLKKIFAMSSLPGDIRVAPYITMRAAGAMAPIRLFRPSPPAPSMISEGGRPACATRSFSQPLAL